MQSTRKPPIVDENVELAGITVSRNGTNLRFVDGVTVPNLGDPNLTWDKVGDPTNRTKGTIWTSGKTTGDHYIQFDLGSMQEVDNISLKIRKDEPWRQRSRNFTIIVFDDTNKEVWRRALGDTAQDSYTFPVGA